MIVSFVCPSDATPMGGVTAQYEFANGLSRRGHEVHIAHGAFWGRNGIASLDEVGWFRFDPAVVHHFGTGPIALPDGDIIFGTGAPARMGLPVLLVQGFEMFPPAMERAAFRTPCLKVCVASWLTEVGEAYGVPREQLAHVAMGVDHTTFRVTRPLDQRPPRVSILRNSHPAKGWVTGLNVLEAVHQQRPEVEILAFGTEAPDGLLPEWITTIVSPSLATLVDEIYNGSRVFLQTSLYEGFGFTAVEAMACGCALVTTDNGGSRDYALAGVTARVAPTLDAGVLTRHVLDLLADEDERLRLASAGQAYVQRFVWEDATAELERHLVQYVADPARYQRPALPDPPGRANSRELRGSDS